MNLCTNSYVNSCMNSENLYAQLKKGNNPKTRSEIVDR